MKLHLREFYAVFRSGHPYFGTYVLIEAEDLTNAAEAMESCHGHDGGWDIYQSEPAQTLLASSDKNQLAHIFQKTSSDVYGTVAFKMKR